MKIKFDQLKISLAVILGIVLIVNLFLISGLTSDAEKKIEEIKELTRPVKLELTIIKDKNCNDCFDLTPIIDLIKNANTDIIKEETVDIKEAKESIDKYSIKKIPTIILAGETDRIELNGFEEKQGILLFNQQKPVYVDAISGETIGEVSLTYIKDSSCSECTDLSEAIDGLEKSGVKVINKKTVERGSNTGKELINKYNIEQIPTLILSNDISAYEQISQVWGNIGTIEKDGSYIIRRISPPFVNASTGSIVGLVDLIMLTDKSCQECYNVTIHKKILNQYGVVLDDEKTLDIADDEGKKLIEKYEIKAAPTIILSKDAGAYSSLVQVWSQVGSIEEDGSLVFREIKAIKGSVYKNLTANEIIT